MALDKKEILEKVNEIVKKIKENKELTELFKKEPVKAVEKALGVDLPDDAVEAVVSAVKAKMTADDVSDLLGAAKKLFSK